MNVILKTVAAALVGITTTAAALDQERIEQIISEMTLEEKIGQLTQYNGSWDVTGPASEAGNDQRKAEDVNAGLVGSMLNVIGGSTGPSRRWSISPGMRAGVG